MADPDPEGSAHRPGLLERLGLKRAPAEPENAAAAEIVHHARAFETVTVGDVMIPRIDVQALELSAPLDEVIAAFAESEHSRLPVYRETLDDPVGVAHLKDVFRLLTDPAAKAAQAGPVLPRLKRDTLYVPASMLAVELLARMQASRIHMAMVIDEFGGLDGLVTLEDVIEAVVGDIDDEHDEAQAAQITARAGGLFEIDGRAPLDELETALGVDLVPVDIEDEDIDTAAGLVAALAGRVPQRGEVVSHPAGFDFEVADADPRRIKRLRARRRSEGE